MARWRRMVVRLWHRARWSYKGVLLWFVRQPGLRFLPWPYPSVSSVAQWRTQAEAMIESRCYPRKWLARASFTASNLSLLAWSRGRVGLSLAFREDPILVGMLMARQRPGRMTQLKNAAIKEEAEKLAKEKDRLKVARALLGPRGGLPTLKSDLIKLAQLLHTEVGEKETVPNIRTKLKPVAAALCQQVSYEQATEHMKSSTTSLPSSAPSSSTTAPTSMATSFGATPVRSQGPVPMSAPLAGNASTSPPMATPEGILQAVDARVAAMDDRFQTMFHQVLHHMMQMQAAPVAAPTQEFGERQHHDGGAGRVGAGDRPQDREQGGAGRLKPGDRQQDREQGGAGRLKPGQRLLLSQAWDRR